MNDIKANLLRALDDPKPTELPPDQSGGTVVFNPSGIFYDGPSGKYLVEAGDYFRTYTRKSPVVTGVERYFRAAGMDGKEAKQEARDAVNAAEIDRHVEWSGTLAGHRRGLIHSADGKPMLVLTSPDIPEPQRGPAPTISAIIAQAFPDHLQRDIFTGWLAGAYQAVRAGIHHPAPMLCLAGKPNTGKSLLAHIVKTVMGGRTANPHNSWFGGLPWNDDLCAAELLLLDDCQGSTDMRSRLNFAAAFKESIFAAEIQMRKRHCSSLSVRPVWRVMVCTNDSPEDLLILPPIIDGMSDKLILLRVEAVRTPVDTSSPEGRMILQRMIEAELPMLANYLTTFRLPAELTDSRSGVLAWRHPDLVQTIESMKPEARLEEILQSAFESFLWADLPLTMTASQIESRLIDKDSPVRDQAKALFGNWTQACGTYCGRLADGGSAIIQPGSYDAHLKVRRFYLKRPSCG